MSRKIKVSILLLIAGFVLIVFATFNEVFGDIGGPGGVDADTWSRSLESLLMNAGPILTSVLLLISIGNKSIILRRIAYGLLALFCIFNLLEDLWPPITGEEGLLIIYVTVGFLSLLAGCVLLFLSAEKCGIGFMIAIIICIAGSLCGLFTILYTFPVVAGLLINRDKCILDREACGTCKP